MGQFFDFIIDAPEDKEQLGPDILCRICIARLRAGMQVFIFIAGGQTTGTGQGKSYFVLRWIDILLKKLGYDFMEYLNDIVVYTPLEFAEKLKAMLYEPRLKHIPVLMVDEASEVVDVSEWQTYVNRTVRSVNVKSRGIKSMVVFFISPDIHDMDKGSRRILTFYGECTRPLSGSTKVIMERPIKIRRGLEDVFYDTRSIKGIVRDLKRKVNYFIYPKFKIKLPRKEIVEVYERLQSEKKGEIVSRELDELISHLQAKYGAKYNRIDLIVNQFVSKPELQPIFFKYVTSRKTGEIKIKVAPEFRKSYDLTETEEKDFIERFMQKFKENKKIEDKISDIEIEDKTDEVVNDGIQSISIPEKQI